MAKKKHEDNFYLVTYRDPQDGKVLSIKAIHIEDSSLGLSFVKISGFIFNTDSIVLQPVEEQLAKRFENVKSLHLSIYSLVSIEEMGIEHKGLTFQKDRSNLIAFTSDSQPPPSI